MLASYKESLSQFLKPYEAHWTRLAPREKWLMKMMGVLLGVALLFWLIWSPITGAEVSSYQKLEKAKADWIWLNEQQSKLTKGPVQFKQAKVDSQTRLTAYIQQQLRAQNLSKNVTQIISIKAFGNDGVEVQFDAVPAPRFFRWLSKMEKEGVFSSKLTMQPIKKGVISAKAQFEVKSQ